MFFIDLLFILTWILSMVHVFIVVIDRVKTGSSKSDVYNVLATSSVFALLIFCMMLDADSVLMMAIVELVGEGAVPHIPVYVCLYYVSVLLVITSNFRISIKNKAQKES